jgi:hypothetical protein
MTEFGLSRQVLCCSRAHPLFPRAAEVTIQKMAQHPLATRGVHRARNMPVYWQNYLPRRKRSTQKGVRI